jgi:membrane protein insertase Oxa1/YidC/SpoIIIJ
VTSRKTVFVTDQQLLFWKVIAVSCNNDTVHARKILGNYCVSARQIGRCSRWKNTELHRILETGYISKHSVVFLVLPQSFFTTCLLLNRNNSLVMVNITIIWDWKFIWNCTNCCPMFDRVHSLKLGFIFILIIIIMITSFCSCGRLLSIIHITVTVKAYLNPSVLLVTLFVHQNLDTPLPISLF